MGLLSLTQTACQLSTALNFDLQFIIIRNKSESNDAIMLTTINSKTLYCDLYLMQHLFYHVPLFTGHFLSFL